MRQKRKISINFAKFNALEITAIGWGCEQKSKTYKLKANPMLSLATLKSHLQTFDTAELTYKTVNSTENLDVVNENKAILVEDLHQMAMFYNLIYGDDLAMLHKTGLPLTGIIHGATLLEKVNTLTVGRGAESGSVVLKWKWLHRINTYQIFYTDNHEQPISHWQTRTVIGMHAVEITDLTSGARYHFCIVPLNKEICETEYYLYSDSVNYVVQ